ncbi:hypothetical protein [Paenibacillus sp.]|uniref:hypothetical protein n=1 Tax=Paenibacillus sp. TaxID=58172 RepID=UPI00281235C7|nr:hypothetical protein [Paenibacillus sp.]
MERTHSRIGIASFILAVVSVLGIIGSAIGASVLAAGFANDPAFLNGVEAGVLPEGMGGFLAVIGLMFLFILTALVGAVLGLVGLFQKERLKLFSILGLVFNSLVVLFVMVIMMIGMLAAPALPGTFQ